MSCMQSNKEAFDEVLGCKQRSVFAAFARPPWTFSGYVHEGRFAESIQHDTRLHTCPPSTCFYDAYDMHVRYSIIGRTFPGPRLQKQQRAACGRRPVFGPRISGAPVHVTPHESHASPQSRLD